MRGAWSLISGQVIESGAMVVRVDKFAPASSQ